MTTFERVKKIVIEHLDIDADKVTKDARFDDLGADSFDRILIAMDIEKEFDLPVDPWEPTERFSTVNDAIDFIESGGKQHARSRLVRNPICTKRISRIARLESRVAELERWLVCNSQPPFFQPTPQLGCGCPPGDELDCGSAACPRRSLYPVEKIT